MADAREAKVPDIGDFDGVPVIEVMVKPGDHVDKDQGLVTLESAKATMEVPAPFAGTVREVKVKVGDEVSEGSVIATIEAEEAGDQASATTEAASKSAPAKPEPQSPASAQQQSAASGGGSGIRDARVPDIGDFEGVPVIEVMVRPGDHVDKDQGLVTLESAKATMEVPAPFAGKVAEVKVKVGDTVSEGSVVATIEAEGGESTESEASPAPPGPGQGKGEGGGTAADSTASRQSPPARGEGTKAPAAQGDGEGGAGRRAPPVAFDADSVMPGKVPYASPAVRAFARELGVDLSRITGSERGGRISKTDVQQFVKSAMTGGTAPAAAGSGAAGLNLLPWPKVDFAKFGEIESRPLSRIQKLSGANLARNWAMIPHVTQFEDADITDLEALRKTLNKENEKAGVKVTLLAFLIKACVAALQKYPDFNASLDAAGENLVIKHYFHVGFAADTPHGLVVPVIRDCDQKGVLPIAEEMSALAKKAREGKLTPGEMSGGCFSISSLGGIGGTMFTPIINAPEVAILGVSKSSTRPVWNGKEFAPRLVLPLSLSYDHRVIDGAAAARFTTYLAQLLGDMRRALL